RRLRIEQRRRLLLQARGDQQAVDLVRSLVDARDARVAVHPLDRKFARVAVAAEQLHRLIDGPSERLARPDLVDRTLDGEPFDGPHHTGAVVAAGRFDRAIDVAERAIRHRVADEGAYGHAGELLFDQTELRDRPPELAPLLRIFHRPIERELHARHIARAELHAAEVQDVERDLVPLSD